MNQRIQELATQATEYADDYCEKVAFTFANWDAVRDQKFAELIVRECAEACYRHENPDGFGIYSIRVMQVSMACERNILQHFGVTDE